MLAARRTELAFHPPAIEIEATPPNPIGRLLAWSIVLLFLAALTWASIGEVDIVAITRGKIIPSGHSKVLQPLHPGSVKALYVEDGQHLGTGELAIQLDDAAAIADLNRLERRERELLTEIDRDEWLLDLLSRYPTSRLAPDTHDIDAAARWQSLVDRFAVAEHELDELTAQRAVAKAEIAKLEMTLPILRQRSEGQAQLAGQKLLAEHQYLAGRQELLEAEHELLVRRARHEQLGKAVAAARARAKSLLSDAESSLRQEYQAKQVELAGIRQDLAKALASHAATRIVSPVDGIVQQLAVHHEGAVVTAAQPLLTVVPDDAQLEVESVLQNRDIGYVHPGDRVAVKIDTFPYTRYGLVDGVVTGISRDAVPDAQGEAVYLMRIRLEKAVMDIDGQPVRLGAGMNVTAEIVTGRRRLIEFLLDHLDYYRSESGRER